MGSEAGMTTNGRHKVTFKYSSPSRNRSDAGTLSRCLAAAKANSRGCALRRSRHTWAEANTFCENATKLCERKLIKANRRIRPVGSGMEYCCRGHDDSVVLRRRRCGHRQIRVVQDNSKGGSPSAEMPNAWDSEKCTVTSGMGARPWHPTEGARRQRRESDTGALLRGARIDPRTWCAAYRHHADQHKRCRRLSA